MNENKPITKKISKVNAISEKEFINLVKTSSNVSEISKKLGYSTSSGGRKEINKRINDLKLDTSHFTKPSNNYYPRTNKSEMSTKQLGNIGESVTLAKFVRLNVPVYIPYGDNEKADLIAEFNGRLNKIQVKTSEFSKNNKISFNLLSHTKSGIHMYNELEVDYFSLYNLQENILLLIPIEKVKGRKTISFNISENFLNKSNNQYKVLDYKDYCFENILRAKNN